MDNENINDDKKIRKTKEKLQGCCGCLTLFFLTSIILGIFFGEEESKNIQSENTTEETSLVSDVKVMEDIRNKDIPFYSLKDISGHKKVKNKIKEDFIKYATNWNCSDAEYKLLKDEKRNCLKILILFKREDLPNNIEKFLERISENVAKDEGEFIVECIVEKNPNLVLQRLWWKHHVIHRSYSVENPISKNIKQDKARVEFSRRRNMIYEFRSILSPWDGSHAGLVTAVKESMNDPSSFQHVKTIFLPSSYEGEGEIRLTMTFREVRMCTVD